MLIYGACFVLGSNYLVSRAFNPRKNRSGSRYGSFCAVGYVLTFLSDMDGASSMGLCSIIFVGCHLEI